jgi:peptide chain release factor 3
LKEPFKRKQLKKGLDQLSEEGVVQVFFDRIRLEREPILGAVGVLQFEVMQYRLKAEYGVDVRFDRLKFQHARWVANADFDADRFERETGATCLLDVEQRPLVLFENDFRLQRAVEKYPDLEFIAAVQPGRRGRAAA